MGFDPLTIGMLVILALLIFFMFRSSRKRQKQAQELQSKVVPGAEVMTNFGLFGKVLSIDAENNKIELETSPGQVLTVHRQTVTRVVDEQPTDTVEDAPVAPVEEAPAGEPEFGERVEPTTDAEDGKPGKADA